MSLSKGATFHVSSSLPTEDDPVLSIPHLARRSPTGSTSSLLSLISEKEDLASKYIQEFEQTFSGARGSRKSAHGPSSARQLRTYRASISSDEGLGSSLSPSSEKGLASNFDRILDLVDKDSGLGSSIHPSEEDGLVKDLIQGWLARSLFMTLDHVNPENTETNPVAPRADPPLYSPNILGSEAASTSSTPSAVTQSIAPSPTIRRRPRLSKLARQEISEHIISPILREDKFKSFHPLVSSLSSSTNKTVRCLRDLEQSLIFQPLVSQLLHYLEYLANAHPSQNFAVSQHLYRLFGEFSIQLVVDTYQHLSEHEQRRASDRPYNNGYFLDLVQQVGQLAAHIGRNRSQTDSENNTNDEMVYSPSDEVTMEGGLAETGNFAELVRWKNGKGVSLRTGEEYLPTAGIKREHSDEDFDEDIARSMARRKKGEVPRIVEMPCSDPTCDKVFTRKCDLAKHEKTHSRPFKCHFKGCKYAEIGLPTEKERERHINDKHDPNPHYFTCDFCEFKTKRESNCKQHMEKKHDFIYERSKGNGRTVKATPTATPQTPSLGYSPVEASPAPSRQWEETSSVYGSEYNSVHATPLEQPLQTFHDYVPPSSSFPLFPPNATAFAQPELTYPAQPAYNMYGPPVPLQTYAPYTNEMAGRPVQHRTPITPAWSPISPVDAAMTDYSMDMTYQPADPTHSHGLPTPNSYSHSRHASMHESPVYNRVQHPSMPVAQATAFSPAADHDAYASHSQLPTEDFNFNDFALSNFTTNAPLPPERSLFYEELNADNGGFSQMSQMPMDEGYGDNMDEYFDFTSTA